MEIFEIKNKEIGARIGKLRTKSGELETPAFFPVINPHLPFVTPKDIKKVGFNSIITNAYSIYQDQKLKHKVKKEGLHKAYGWENVIATDSGAFQLWQYKDFLVSNLEMCEFQKKIGADIGAILDVPFGRKGKEKKKRAIIETAERAREAHEAELLGEKEETILMGPIHGAPHLDLLNFSIKKMTKFPFRMYAIGSIVPLMKDYRYKSLIRALLFARSHIPFNFPIHLFGAGHPIALALFTALGFDTFDSASYAEFAKKDRYITSHGSIKLKDLSYFPCTCPVCSSWKPKEIQKLNKAKRRHYLALHNLYTIKKEINSIRQAIKEGRLWKLIVNRIESHPKLAAAYHWLLEGGNIQPLEKMDPVYKKRGLLITRQEERNRPQIIRYKNRILERLYLWADKMIFTDHTGASEIPDRIDAQVFILDPFFGVIPREINAVYPLFQHESFLKDFSSDNFSYIEKFMEKLKEKGVERFFLYNVENESIHKMINSFGELREYKGEDLGILDENTALRHRLRAMFRYQFGPGAEKAVINPIVRRSGTTNKIREIYEQDVKENEINCIIKSEMEKGKKNTAKEKEPNQLLENKEKWLLAALVPQNYKIVPHPLLAWRFRELLGERYCVKVEDEAVPFIKEGKSIFAKFVSFASQQIRANDEVIVLSEEENLIAIGKAVLGGEEMMDFQRGVAVENRWGNQGK